MYKQLKKKHPNKSPVVLDTSHIEIKQKKFLIDSDMNVAEFIQHFKQKYVQNIKKNQALVFLFNNNLEPMNRTFTQIENNNLIHLNILVEDTFG